MNTAGWRLAVLVAGLVCEAGARGVDMQQLTRGETLIVKWKAPTA